MQFMQGSLATHAKNLPKDKLKHTSALAFEYGVDVALLQRKGIYPYSWANGNLARFMVEQLPPIKEFHNDLDDEACSKDDYAHAEKVWKAAECQTFGDYHDLYL